MQDVDTPENNEYEGLPLRSGNPGYLKGHSILCREASTYCIDNHLKILTPSSNGECVSNSDLNYGSGFTSYCTISNLRDYAIELSNVRIGMYGNSNPSRDVEWVEIKTRITADYSGSCDSITIQFIYSYIGAYPNAQEIIIGWEIRCEESINGINKSIIYLK